jgi:SAM-dependent methyltransferase
MSRALLLGAGNNRALKVGVGTEPVPTTIVTLDMDIAAHPDLLHDLEQKPWPALNDSFDQIHAYEVLEHLGRQGDWRGFFDDFAEIYRILRPGGHLVFSSPLPESVWAWGDPGHTRIVSLESLTFLDQDNYKQVGTTPMTDYRGYWKGNLKLVGHQKTEHNLFAILQAVKNG